MPWEPDFEITEGQKLPRSLFQREGVYTPCEACQSVEVARAEVSDLTACLKIELQCSGCQTVRWRFILWRAIEAGDPPGPPEVT